MSDSNSYFEAPAKNQVWFKVENQTGFLLTPQDCYADWGDYSDGRNLVRRKFLIQGMLLSISHQVKPELQGNGGYIVSSRLGIGSASARPVWSGILFSLEVFHNPYFSDSLPLTLIGEIEKSNWGNREIWSTALALKEDPTHQPGRIQGTFRSTKKGNEFELQEGTFVHYHYLMLKVLRLLFYKL